MSKANTELLNAINYHMDLKGKKPISYFQDLYKCKLVESYTRGDIFQGVFISETGVRFTIHTFNNSLITYMAW